MQITATMVKELRERTGAGMMDCKKALQEAAGDIETAIEEMRISGVAKAAKKAGRIAAEGSIIIQEDAETGAVVMVEVNSETDFVAKDDGFKNFSAHVAASILDNRPADVDALMAAPVQADSDLTVEDARQQLVAKIGENISVRRFVIAESSQGKMGTYLHMNRIGVVVDIEGGDADLVKDIAMHIAGTHTPPVCITEDEVPGDLLEKEKEIYNAQAMDSGKTPEIIEKMVAGKLKKFTKEVALLSQPFIKDTEQTIGQLLDAAGARVISYYRFQLGEGLEKREDNFVKEVMDQAKGV